MPSTQHTKQSKSKKPTLEELTFGALSQLQALCYNGRSIRRYQTTWRKLIAFAKDRKFKDKLTEKLILEFLEYYEIKPNVPKYTYKGWRRHAEFSLRILWNYARYGYLERCKTTLSKLDIPLAMQKTFYKYKTYCEEKRYLSPYTINEAMRQIGLFLDFLGKRKVKVFSEIQERDITDFIYSLSRFSKKTVSSSASYIRVFLKFLILKGQLKKDLSYSVPSIHISHQAKIPSVWDRELVVQLLDAVDRSSPKGKRDYAILLLAYRLGLRISDIRSLKLDNIDWKAESIFIVQSKTKAPLTLPLTHDVGSALVDYVKFARPKTHYREVFLSFRPPFKPFAESTHLYSVVKDWKEIAGIKFKTKQRSGMHSLRHSLATHLLEEDVPFSLISNILGHTSMNSTMIYAKSSVETLRQAALSIEEVRHEK